MVFTLVQQVLIMLILSLVGYIMFKFKKISREGSKSLGNILIYLSLPCVIINGFLLECTPERLKGLLISSALSLIVLIICILVSSIIFSKNAIEAFGAAFSNPGFFGVPLIVASLSDGSVFYIASFIAFLNLSQWTYGVSLMTKSADSRGKKEPLSKRFMKQLEKLIKAPFMIAILIGLFFFLTGIQMPPILGKCISQIAGLNTPLAMFTIGIYLAQTNILQMFTKPRLYLVTLIRMIIIPAIVIALFCLVPNSWIDLKLAILIAAACPVGSNIAVYAQLHDNDYPYAVETVVISTLFSVVTIPFIVSVANMIWGTAI